MLRSFFLLVGWVLCSEIGAALPGRAQDVPPAPAPRVGTPAPAPRPVAPVPGAPVMAVDTVQLTLAQAEQRFVQSNLLLLAQRYNITAAQAQILQARLWDNPVVSVEQNIHNPETGRSFDVTRTGESILQVQQLIVIAGRRRAAANVAQAAAQVEQYNLQDLLRTLRFQLRTAFYDLYYKQRTLAVYDTEITSFQRIIPAYQQQYEKGNIAQKEVVRLKAFLFVLQNQRQQLFVDMAPNLSDLRILTRDTSGAYLVPQVNLPRTRDLSLGPYAMQQLVDSAQILRGDLLARTAYLQQQGNNLHYQRALATPDLLVGYTYDRAGSYIQNYNALTLGVAVPIFNRNQGNIRTAEALIQGGQAQLGQARLVVQNEVQQNYQLVGLIDAQFREADRDTTPFDRIIGGIEQAYARRLIGLVEFLDYYQSYNDNLVQLNQLRASRMRAFEQLNAAVGRPVFRAE